jgi:hypothetical protein
MMSPGAWGRLTRRAIPARRKVHCCQEQGKDKAVPRTHKGRTFGKRRRSKPEPRLKEATASGKQAIWQDLQEDRRAGIREANGRNFY